MTSASTADGLYRFDRAEANRASDFFRTFLTHQKGEWAGRPLELVRVHDGHGTAPDLQRMARLPDS